MEASIHEMEASIHREISKRIIFKTKILMSLNQYFKLFKALQPDHEIASN